jgi:hypothetical protein
LEYQKSPKPRAAVSFIRIIPSFDLADFVGLSLIDPTNFPAQIIDISCAHLAKEFVCAGSDSITAIPQYSVTVYIN